MHSSMMELAKERNEMFNDLVEKCLTSGEIDQNLYIEYDVKRGLRDSSGKGVLTGLTEISDVRGTRDEAGIKVPAPGQLYYQGYNVKDIIHGLKGRKFAFEEITYLLLFGNLPTKEQFENFNAILTDLQELQGDFVRNVILHNPSANIMNSLQKAILNLYSYDDDAESIEVSNVLRQCLQLIGKTPLMSVYAYHAYRHFNHNENLVIRNPIPEYSTAENILNMLRPDGKFTELEAYVLDIALVLHAEHGGGNNSSLTVHVVSSADTDPYSAIAAAVGSLKGRRHGGANIRVMEMMDDIKANVKDWADENEVREYLRKISRKEAFDHTGLIYGMGHAVYTISDPREVLLKKKAKALAEEKGPEFVKEFNLYDTIERIAPQVIAEYHHSNKKICANVDLYSGFVYTMLNIPRELYTPLFAISRIAGWSAHRIEEVVAGGRIYRPAYKCISKEKKFIPLMER